MNIPVPAPTANNGNDPSRTRWLATLLTISLSCSPASDAFSSPLPLPPSTLPHRRSPTSRSRRIAVARSSNPGVDNEPSSRVSAEKRGSVDDGNGDGDGDGDDMKSLGERVILRAALAAGATAPMIDVEWRADRIVVTVDASKDESYVEGDKLSSMGGSLDDDLSVGEEMDYLEKDNFLFDGDDVEFDPNEDGDEEFNEDDYIMEIESSSTTSIDVSLIARNINELLSQDGEESLGYTIAKLHEIEVTTPFFDNVLRGPAMFESYKGFDVIVEHWEEPKKKKKPKKKGKAQKENVASVGDSSDGDVEEVAVELKLKTTEGKLVERDYDKGITTINVKGRRVKIKNDKIDCVRLPTAKREKGSK